MRLGLGAVMGVTPGCCSASAEVLVRGRRGVLERGGVQPSAPLGIPEDGVHKGLFLEHWLGNLFPVGVLIPGLVTGAGEAACSTVLADGVFWELVP